MASNSDPRKKQKRTAVDGDSSPSSTFVLVAPVLSFGNILHHFPEFLMHILTYIADRTVFNSIASCNRDAYAKSKAVVPPWPKYYQLSGSETYSITVWSPDGTRVAYRCSSALGVRDVITIADQRYGIIHRINNNGVFVSELIFSPNGRFLVSSFGDGTVKLWDNNVTGNYEQLQEWNMREDVGERWPPMSSIDISVCSKYIVVARNSSTPFILKCIENGGTVRSLTPQPAMTCINEVIFSVDFRTIFVCGRVGDSSVIKLWRPYLDDVDEDRLITLWEYHNPGYGGIKIIPSHDKTMIAIQDQILNKGWLLSIDNNYSCTVQKLDVPVSYGVPVLLQFTPDDEYIIYATKNGLKYWSVGETKFTDNECLFYNKRTTNTLRVVNCSPDNRQLIVYDSIEEGDSPLYIMKSIS